MKYIVVGTFRRAHKDCEGETQVCNSYAEALAVKEEFKNNKKYKKVIIVRDDD